ncbi:leucine-rich repeat-containing protein kinase family protein [Paludibacterium paludis]|uniref:Protein kinase domain-containing protein n=1 Tax=Paludibacterium paludis TaxID=1225769 RepID=A0A918UAQ6_9NEIS|nr:leucine-rich repeat-containing protein kinase family protein [Paludibacterium paludis]GGY18397.1 hypothetical protein GCM10011289_22350 [Paludibacterium paludis]
MHTLEQLEAGRLAGARSLKLSEGLERFPEAIFRLADTLEVLDLSGNRLAELPDDLWRLGKLRILFCSGNRLESLPSGLGRCASLSMLGVKANRIARIPENALSPGLRWLILTDNHLAALPETLGRCRGMQKLMLAGNRLEHLPDSMAALERLELLRLSANRFSGLPAWLAGLPNLAWLAFSGNPFHDAAPPPGNSDAVRIPWRALTLGRRLGEGASGVIHRAVWRHNGENRDVAVKLFKGSVTSDGLPMDEMAACLAAGQHNALIGALGRLESPPDGAPGLVMPLIAEDFVALAAPPDFDTCTRDVYPPDLCFAFAATVSILQRIASAVRHLHQQGMLHGDLYAHNILHNHAGDARLGDFGAASRLPSANPAFASALTRLEVKAFACLAGELLARTSPLTADTARFAALQRLVEHCAHPDPGCRPAFPAIAASLESMA